jgi:hypothetical protein
MKLIRIITITKIERKISATKTIFGAPHAPYEAPTGAAPPSRKEAAPEEPADGRVSSENDGREGK